MSYQGYTPLMVSYLDNLNCTRVENFKNREGTNEYVKILEIGVDRGQTSIILMSSLVAKGIPFIWVGVDIRRDDNLVQQINLMEGVDHYFLKDQVAPKSYAIYDIANSLDHLRKDKNQYDLVLIDGDHNYDTVTQELSFLDKITHDLSLVICDDYAGIHAGKDSFYSDNELHRSLEHASTNLSKDVNKGGASAAIDEFILNHDNWFGSHDTNYEVCFLYKKLGFQFRLAGNILDGNRSLLHPENFDCSFYSAEDRTPIKHMLTNQKIEIS